MRIDLARHGKVALRVTRWLTPEQMSGWVDDYNGADVVVETIPFDIKQTASSAGVIVCSTTKRSVQSAQHLRTGGQILSEPLFREADLPVPHWSAPALPSNVWAAVFRIAWFLGYSDGGETRHDAEARSLLAARRLIELAEQYDSVLLIGHGVMTHLIGSQLAKLGWIGPKWFRGGHWKSNVYRAVVADSPTGTVSSVN